VKFVVVLLATYVYVTFYSVPIFAIFNKQSAIYTTILDDQVKPRGAWWFTCFLDRVSVSCFHSCTIF